MKPQELQKIGKSLFGSQWQTPLSESLGVRRETVSRWTRGIRKIPSPTAKAIRLLSDQTPCPYFPRRFNAKGEKIVIQDATLIHGDSRHLLEYIQDPIDAILTDPVWPNALPQLAGSRNPRKLLSDTLLQATKLLKPTGRIIIHLRCDSDPRILTAIPAGYQFLRIAWLPYAIPSKKGRILISSDVAYIFGKPPPVRAGHRVLPGQIHIDHCPPMRPEQSQVKHPCPRNLEHVEWLVEKFTAPGEMILDPFLGSGTTAVAALRRGRQCIGIEIERKYWTEACERLS